MARDFKILDLEKRDWLFVDEHAVVPYQYVSYLHFIVQILGQLLRNGGSIEECKSSYEEFKSAFDKKQRYPNDGCESNSIRLKLYWLQDLPSYAILIDETNWCFPLVIDSDTRAWGLKKSVEDINNHIDEILEELQKHGDKEWDEKLQKKMEEFEGRNQQKKAA